RPRAARVRRRRPADVARAAVEEAARLERGDDRVPQPNESGSSRVRCWLDSFVYGSELIGVPTTLPAYPVAASAKIPTSTTRATDASLLRFPLPTTPDRIPGLRFRKRRVHSRPVAKRLLEPDRQEPRADEELEDLKQMLRERAAAVSIRERELDQVERK